MASPLAIANFADSDPNRIALALAGRRTAKTPTAKETPEQKLFGEAASGLQADLEQYGSSALKFFDGPQNELIGAASELATNVIRANDLTRINQFSTKLREQNSLLAQADQNVSSSITEYSAMSPYVRTPKLTEIVKARTSTYGLTGETAVDPSEYTPEWIGVTVSQALSSGQVAPGDILNVEKLQTDIRARLADNLEFSVGNASMGKSGVITKQTAKRVTEGQVLQMAIRTGALTGNGGVLKKDINGITKLAVELGVSNETLSQLIQSSIEQVATDPQMIPALDLYLQSKYPDEQSQKEIKSQPGNYREAIVLSFIDEFSVADGEVKVSTSTNITSPQFDDDSLPGFTHGTDFSASKNADGTINIVPNKPGSTSRLAAPVVIDLTKLNENDRSKFSKSASSVEAHVSAFDPKNNSFRIQVPTDNLSAEQKRQGVFDGNQVFMGEDAKEYTVIEVKLDNSNTTRVANAVGQNSWIDVTNAAGVKTKSMPSVQQSSKPAWRPTK